MMKAIPKQIFHTIILCLLLPAAELSAPAGAKETSDPGDFIRRQGKYLVVGANDTPLLLRGIGLSGYIFHMWEGHPEEIIDYDHHSEVDFRRIAALGMNTVRIAQQHRSLLRSRW